MLSRAPPLCSIVWVHMGQLRKLKLMRAPVWCNVREEGLGEHAASQHQTSNQRHVHEHVQIGDASYTRMKRMDRWGPYHSHPNAARQFIDACLMFVCRVFVCRVFV